MGKLIKYLKNYWAQTLLVFVLLIVQAYCDLSLPDYTADIMDTGIMQKGVENIAPQVISEEAYNGVKLFMTDAEKKEVDENYVRRDSLKDCKSVPVSDDYSEGAVYELEQTDEKIIENLNDDFGYPLMTYSVMGEMTVEQAQAMMKAGSADADENPQMAAEEQSDSDTAMQTQQTSSMTDEDIAKMQAAASKDNSQTDGTAQAGQIPADMKMTELVSMGMADGLEIRDNIAQQYKDMSDTAVEQSAKSFIQTEYSKIGVDLDQLETDYLKIAGVKMLGMAGLIMVCTIIICYLAAKIGSGIGLDLRVGVFKKVISFSNEEMDKFSTSSLITRSTNDIQQIQMVLTMMLRMCMYAPILGVGGLIKVLNTNTSMVWIIGVAVAAVLIIVGILMVIAMPKFKIMQKKVDKLNLVTREILTGLPVIRAFSREKHEEKRFDETNVDLTKTMLFTNRVMTFMMPIMMLIMNGVSVLIVWIAAKQIDLGNLQVGSMTAFITYAMMIIMSFLMLTMISVMLPRAAVAAERVDEILTTKPIIVDKPDSEKAGKITKGVVKFDHVNFRYNNADADVLEDIDFTAECGKTTAIIGSTGSGKSTLIHLIPRFYDVTEGKITIDGVDIRDYSQKNLREAIGFVPQKGVLFSGDINSNLSFGCPDATHEQLEKAAEIAQATEFINTKPDGYTSSIAQGGNNVSGGQKQRLSIARAIAKNPKILIFDDSFSALDFKTDVALRKALSENVSNATVLIVAQRIVTIMNADEIIVLDEGKIAGKGTHYELLRNCEVYEQIVKSQLSETEYNKQLAQANEQAQGKGEV